MSYQLEKQVVDRLKVFFDHYGFIDKVVIFGSRAKHNANPKSDIDLCVYSLEMSDVQFSKLKLSLDELPILYAIDIVHFEKSNEALRENIERDGKLLFIKKANMGDVALFIRNGLTVQQDKNKKLGCPISRIETISHGVINFDAVGYADLDKDKYESWLLKKGDILISHINSEKHLGKSAIYTDEKAIIHGMNLLNLRVKENISPKYLFYFLKTPTYKESIHKIMKRSVNQASFSLGGFKNIEIPLPSLTKQKEIAQKLDKASELIELRKATILKLDELSKAIFIDMFGDPVSNSKKLKTKKLGSLTEVKTGKTPSRQEPLYWENGTELWATTTEVNQKNISDTNEKITMFAVTKNNLTVYPKNTILMAMYGQGKTRGKVALLLNESTINQAFCAILPNKSFNTKFLLSLLENSYEDIRSLGRGGNQENLNLDIVKNYEVIFPKLEEQNEFSSVIEQIESQKSLYEAELTKLQENFNALMAQSFEG